MRFMSRRNPIIALKLAFHGKFLRLAFARKLDIVEAFFVEVEKFKEFDEATLRTLWFKFCDWHSTAISLEVPDGWIHIVLATDSLMALIDNSYRVTQVKQKFNGMRYYLGSYEDARLMYLEMVAEYIAEYTCGVCGSKAPKSPDFTKTAVCDACREKGYSNGQYTRYKSFCG